MHKKIMISVFALLLVLIPILSAILMPKEAQPFSENENRYLAKFPTVSWKAVEDKTFMNGFDEWVSDRFMLRENWIVAKNNNEKLLGKTEINGVFTYDDRMMEVWKGYDRESTDKSLAAINAFAKRHSEVPTSIMLVPNAQEIYSDTLPQEAVIGNQKSFIKYCYESLPDVTGIDAYSSLSASRDSYIYYRTDHHWTSYGAFLGYTALSGKLGFTPYSLNSFNIEHASSDFRGTLFSKTLDSGVTPDILDFYTLSAGDPTVKLSMMNGAEATVYDSLYFREYLDKKDKYSAFLGQMSPIMYIESDIPNNDKTLLVFKDSYANALLPFLAKNYSKIAVLDMRYINVSYEQFINVEDYDQTLFLYNVITFSEDNNIKKLNMANG